MATHANTTATAKRNALRKVTTIQAVPPLAGWALTYYSTTLGLGQVTHRLCNAAGMVVAYRAVFSGRTHTVPAGNLEALNLAVAVA